MRVGRVAATFTAGHRIHLSWAAEGLMWPHEVKTNGAEQKQVIVPEPLSPKVWGLTGGSCDSCRGDTWGHKVWGGCCWPGIVRGHPVPLCSMPRVPRGRVQHTSCIVLAPGCAAYSKTFIQIVKVSFSFHEYVFFLKLHSKRQHKGRRKGRQRMSSFIASCWASLRWRWVVGEC